MRGWRAVCFQKQNERSAPKVDGGRFSCKRLPFIPSLLVRESLLRESLYVTAPLLLYPSTAHDNKHAIAVHASVPTCRRRILLRQDDKLVDVCCCYYNNNDFFYYYNDYASASPSPLAQRTGRRRFGTNLDAYHASNECSYTISSYYYYY